MDILVFGYGNPSRGDDCLGISFAESIEKKSYTNVETDTNYQLNAEEALSISTKDLAIFVDASENDIKDFRITRLEPTVEVFFSTHAMSPGSILALCHELYNKKPATFLLEIKGYTWELGEPLSEKADSNLKKALEFFDTMMKDVKIEKFDEVAEVIVK